MIQSSTGQTIAIFPLFMGCLVILLVLFERQLMQFIGLKPRSDVFSEPRFQRSAKMTENLGRLFLLVIGAGFLVQGIGPIFLPNEVTCIISIISMGLSGLIVLVVIGMNLLAIRKG
jgi:hypothetical protein